MITIRTNTTTNHEEPIMLKNYLKIAWRNLSLNKGFTFINIVGLSVGMAGSLLILLWVYHQFTFDRFHPKADQLYQVWCEADFNGELTTFEGTPQPMAFTLKDNFAEIAAVTRFNHPNPILMQAGDIAIKQITSQVDPDFFKMFDFPLLYGDPDLVFSDPNVIVLTESAALRQFGKVDVVGETILLEKQLEVTVKGVLKDLPNNTAFQFDAVLPWQLWNLMGFESDFWGNYSTATYVELQGGASLAQTNNLVKDIIRNNSTENVGAFLYPLKEVHLYSKFKNGVVIGGKITLVKQFTILAIFILVIACMNFMNLSTARSEKRAKEVGVRKLSGADRGMLIRQFLSESVLLTLFSAIVAYFIFVLVLPFFNQVMDTQLEVPYTNVFFWALFIAFALVTGLLSGSYPAFFLSAFSPTKVLKGYINSPKSAFTLRKSLVVFQFTISVMLIAATLIVKSQLDHVLQREVGFDRDQLVFHELNESLGDSYEPFRNALLQSGAVTSVTRTMSPISEGYSSTWSVNWEGKNPDVVHTFDRFSTDSDLVKTAGLKLIAGRDIDIYTYPSDSSAMLINQTMAELVGSEAIIGELLEDNAQQWHVVGVVEDFIQDSPFGKVNPMIIAGPGSWFTMVHFRLNPDRNVQDNVALIQKVFEQHNPDYPFDYQFVDQAYAAKFDDQQRTARLTMMFSALAIIISCLGLLGLAAFTAEQRIKEVGVRRVLGASVQTILLLLTKDFVRLVIVSIVLAVPITWYLMNKWLADFTYRIAIDWKIFLITGVVTMLIAVITVSSQAFKAALSNPVDSLKNE